MLKIGSLWLDNDIKNEKQCQGPRCLMWLGQRIFSKYSECDVYTFGNKIKKKMDEEGKIKKENFDNKKGVKIIVLFDLFFIYHNR